MRRREKLSLKEIAYEQSFTSPFCALLVVSNAARIRTHVSIPMAVAGRIRTPDVARETLALQQAHWIGLARPFLADPDWVYKTEAGDEVAILRCAACHQGCLTESRKGHGTSCLFNPLTGRESEVQIRMAEQPRHVMVAGGGPVGMEAAIIAAQRGHHSDSFCRGRGYSGNGGGRVLGRAWDTVHCGQTPA